MTDHLNDMYRYAYLLKDDMNPIDVTPTPEGYSSAHGRVLTKEEYDLYLEEGKDAVTRPVTGLRANTGKPELSMMLEAAKAVEGLSRVLMYGRDKYSRGNWLGGLGHMSIVDCLMRHLTAYVSGENLDEESGLPHVDHVLANALFLSQMTKTRHDLDDRVPPF